MRMLLGAWEQQMSYRYVNHHGRPAFQRKREQPFQVRRVVCPHADCAERLGELDQVWIQQVCLVSSVADIGSPPFAVQPVLDCSVIIPVLRIG